MSGGSGLILAAKRLVFTKPLTFSRKKDTLHVYTPDRLGRDALNVQSTVVALAQHGRGPFTSKAGV